MEKTISLWVSTAVAQSPSREGIYTGFRYWINMIINLDCLRSEFMSKNGPNNLNIEPIIEPT